MTGAPARVWRHPRPEGVAGRCIGAGTDVAVHWRRAKRLARRIQALARRERLAHVVWTSPLRRGADVGRWLARWGWRHHVDARLSERDFGAWDGATWDDIGPVRVDEWVADFVDHRPAGGESLRQVSERAASVPLAAGSLVVGHAGWMLARRWADRHGPAAGARLRAADWGPAPAYGSCWIFSSAPGPRNGPRDVP